MDEVCVLLIGARFFFFLLCFCFVFPCDDCSKYCGHTFEKRVALQYARANKLTCPVLGIAHVHSPCFFVRSVVRLPLTRAFLSTLFLLWIWVLLLLSLASDLAPRPVLILGLGWLSPLQAVESATGTFKYRTSFQTRQ